MISKLHYITQDLAGYTHPELAEHACKGGANWVQLRVKNKNFEEWLHIAEQTKIVCSRYKAKLIINDNAEIARMVNADGLHLGNEDMSPIEARKIVGEMIIGGSTNSMEDIRRMHSMGVDYLGIGPLRFTTTKEKLNPVLGMEGMKNIISACQAEGISIPLIAIGGIQLEDVDTIMNIGLHGIAVSSAISHSNSMEQATNDFMKEIYQKEKIKTF